MKDTESSWLDSIMETAASVLESAKEAVQSKIDAASEAIDSIRADFDEKIETIKFVHHEVRDGLNTNLPTFDEATSPDSGWWLAPPSESKFHDDKIGKPELKYVHEDGREVVYDGDTQEIVTDSRYKGTYNYHPMMPREYYPDGLGGWTEKLQDGISHTLEDIVPYTLWGTDRDAD